ncbi:MAG: hypothetical protein ABEJ74_06940 [Haloferacaceae archaeon]
MPPGRGARFYLWVAVGGAWSLFLGTGLAFLVSRPLARIEIGGAPGSPTTPVDGALASTLAGIAHGAYTTGVTSMVVGIAVLLLGVRLSLRSGRTP